VQSRRDQVQAHQFMVGRLVSALVRTEPDAAETPMRRSTTGAVAGVIVAVLAVAGFAVVGLLRPGDVTAWRKPGSIIVEKETGTRFILAAGVLRPVTNLASARLLSGSGAAVLHVSARSLAGVRHGTPVGILGAPDDLPDPARLSNGPWLICSPADAGADRARPLLTMSVGTGAAASAAPLPAGTAVLVHGGDATYLAWHGTRLRVPGQASLLALGYGTARPLPVAPSWLDALPAGPELAAQPVPGRGGAGPRVNGQPTRVGQVLSAPDPRGTDAFYLVRPGGLAPLTRTEAALLLGDPASRLSYPDGRVRAVPVDTAAVVEVGTGDAGTGAASGDPAGLPAEPPALLDGASAGRVPCVRAAFRPGAPPDLQLSLVDAAVAATGQATPPAAAQATGGTAADLVALPSGAGLLVQAVPRPGLAGARYLVTDLGVKYPLPSDDAVRQLGFDGVAALPVPGTTLALLPTGPVLDRAAAAAPQIAVAAGPTSH
jgi:type VII secretion protein EccB